jgi:hypothetical protein
MNWKGFGRKQSWFIQGIVLQQLPGETEEAHENFESG